MKGEFMAGPYGQWPELARHYGRARWRAKVKITPNFSFASEGVDGER